MIEVGLVEILLLVLMIANIVMVGVFIWGICSIEDAVRDDLQRYKEELSLEQIQKAIAFYESMKGKK
jgi:hypothetical protein